MEKILCSGFDADFGTSSPKGVWLSTNSQYSTGFSGGTGKMFLVRCVLGYIGQITGRGEMSKVNGECTDSHHCGGKSSGHIRRDDQTGGGADNRYVVNRNNQVYPAYVVEF